MADKTEELVEYRMVGSHPYEVRKGENVVMLGPGEFIELDSKDLKHEDNKPLLADGILLNTEKNIAGKKSDVEEDN